MAIKVGDWGGGCVWRTTGGIFPSNTYFCTTDSPGGCVLIDPGLDATGIEAQLTGLGLRPTQIFCTHGHFDHIGSAAYFQKKYGVEVFLHKADIKTMKASNFLLMAFKIPERVVMPDVTGVEAGHTADVCGGQLIFHHAPGHTDGSGILELGNMVFTGDTIYSRGIGLSRLPGEDPRKLRNSILSLWDKIATTKVICPGHGDCAEGAVVRRNNKQLLDFLGISDIEEEVL